MLGSCYKFRDFSRHSCSGDIFLVLIVGEIFNKIAFRKDFHLSISVFGDHMLKNLVFHLS